MPEAADPQRRAELARDAMYPDDHAARSLGIVIADVGPGRCTASMTVRQDMLNSFGMCHGGFVTSLADSAFAYACNSHGGMTVAAGFDAEFVKAARLGDVLTAEALERSQAGRLGLYDVSVRNQHGEIVAFLRGRSYRMRVKSPGGE
jgi:acyl-CoA thioesterase